MVKLAEKAGITTQYVAMIELTRQFPTPEVLERIAEAFEIEAYELFSVPSSPEDSLHLLMQQIMDDLDRAIGNAVDKAIDRKLKGTEAKS